MKLVKVLILSLILIKIAKANTLIISDSHSVGAFGGELASLLESEDVDLDYYAFGGSKPIDWIEGTNLTWGFWEHHTGKKDLRGTNRAVPIFTELIQKHLPNRVIIVQGTNTVWYQEKETDVNAMRFLLNVVQKQNAECIWVGPPDLIAKNADQARTINDFHLRIEKETAENNCKLIKSWEFTHYPEKLGDGVHYDNIPVVGKRMSRKWAQKVFELISP